MQGNSSSSRYETHAAVNQSGLDASRLLALLSATVGGQTAAFLHVAKFVGLRSRPTRHMVNDPMYRQRPSA